MNGKDFKGCGHACDRLGWPLLTNGPNSSTSITHAYKPAAAYSSSVLTYEEVVGVGRSEWVFGKGVGFAHSLTKDPQGVGF